MHQRGANKETESAVIIHCLKRCLSPCKEKGSRSTAPRPVKIFMFRRLTNKQNSGAAAAAAAALPVSLPAPTNIHQVSAHILPGGPVWVVVHACGGGERTGEQANKRKERAHRRIVCRNPFLLLVYPSPEATSPNPPC